MATLEELEKRIQTLEDIESLKKLEAQYLNNLNDLKSIDEFFTEDATMNSHAFGEYKRGSKREVEVAAGVRERISTRRVAHYAIHPIISVDGDKASAKWVCYINNWDVDTPQGQGFRQVVGLHEQWYEKRDGKWKIVSNKYSRPYPPELKCGELYAKGSPWNVLER